VTRKAERELLCWQKSTAVVIDRFCSCGVASSTLNLSLWT